MVGWLFILLVAVWCSPDRVGAHSLPFIPPASLTQPLRAEFNRTEAAAMRHWPGANAGCIYDTLQRGPAERSLTIAPSAPPGGTCASRAVRPAGGTGHLQPWDPCAYDHHGETMPQPGTSCACSTPDWLAKAGEVGWIDTAHLCIATGCVDYDCESVSGRRKWLNPDPIGETGGLNLYGFVDNNPVNFIDSLGLQSAGAFVRFGMELGARPPPTLPRALVEECLRFNKFKHRVDLPDGRAVDLAGRGHVIDKITKDEIPTPHTHYPKPANPPPNDIYPPGLQDIPNPATLGDLLDALLYVKGSLLVPGGMAPINAPPSKVVGPPGFKPSLPPVPKPVPPGAVEA